MASPDHEIGPFYKHPTDYGIRGTGVCFARETPCEQGLPHCTCCKQSNASLMCRRRRRSAVSPRNVDPLRSTTYCGIRSTRKHRGNSFALSQQSCPASLLVTLVKLGGCCRTDGTRRALSCQMWHTITAINAAWCRSIRWASSPRASVSVSCEKFTICSKR